MKLSSNIYLVVSGVVIFLSFFCLDLQSVSTGDDLGYMFTDSVHHNCDGNKVHSLSDISKTLAAHYLTTNGRFIVHWIAMFFLNIAGHFWFCFTNSIVFLITTIYFSKLSTNSFPLNSGGLLIATTIVLLLSVPEPGINWLGLVCYSTNYLWPTLASLWFLSTIMQNETATGEYQQKNIGFKAVGIYFLSFLSGALQESFSIPISAALLSLWLVKRREFKKAQIIKTVCYWTGTAIIILAPGNIHHAEQGGGFTANALLSKISALGFSILTQAPSIILAVIFLIAGVIIYRRSCYRFLKNNLVIWVSIVTSLLLATLTFTSGRQLTLPAVLSSVLIIKIFFSGPEREVAINKIRRFDLVFMIIYIGAFCGIYLTRQETKIKYRSIYEQAECGNKILVFDETMPENKMLHRLFRRFDYARLPVIFDGYTKRGLSRLFYDNDLRKIKTILPAPPEYIYECAQYSRISRDKVETTPLCKGFRCFLISKVQGVKHLRDVEGRPINYERVVTEKGILVVVPDLPTTGILTYSN